VGAGHEADEEQRVGYGNPQRAGPVDSVKLGKLGYVNNAQQHTTCGEQPEQQD
jgi:hypothetical protein